MICEIFGNERTPKLKKNEPAFMLRATNSEAIPTLRYYISLRKQKANWDKKDVAVLEEYIGKMRSWRETNPELCAY